MEGMPAPPGRDRRAVLKWFIENYPMGEEEREKMMRLYEENEKKQLNSLDDLKFLPRHFGVAIMRIAMGACRQSEEAPGQTMFPDVLLEKHCVFPLFVGVSMFI